MAPLLVERLRITLRRHLRSLLAEDFAEVELRASRRGMDQGVCVALGRLYHAARSETARERPVTGADLEAMLLNALDACDDATRPDTIDGDDAHDDRGHL